MTTVDGTTQPGYVPGGIPMIAINGSMVSGTIDGLDLTGGSSTVKALTIYNFGANGLELDNAGGDTFQGCFIGTNASGIGLAGNRGNGIDIESGANNNTIGGATAAVRNVISGNVSWGISAIFSNNNTIEGNYIGTDLNGTKSLGNLVGIAIANGTANQIGGTLAGQRNVIAGNQGNGVSLSSAVNSVIEGNYIGTDFTGTMAPLNQYQTGILINSSSGTQIGGTLAGQRNLISGNQNDGVQIDSTSASTVIQGNYVGTDKTGTKALANGLYGVSSSSNNTTIGGTVAGAGNLISGNAAAGIALSSSSNDTIQGNFVGTNFQGLVALPNRSGGISLMNVTNSLIGGTTAAARNLIAGNMGDGLDVNGGSGNLVQGNYIGTDYTGTKAPAGGSDTGTGVSISGGATNTTIGGTGSGQANLIWYDGANGVKVSDSDTTGNAIRHNSIFAHTAAGALGIALASGGNLGQFAPTVTGVAFAGGMTTIAFSFSGPANMVMSLDFFATPSATPSGSYEGKVYLGSATGTTNGSGTGSGMVTFGGTAAQGQYTTAMATDSAGNTSPFSTGFHSLGPVVLGFGDPDGPPLLPLESSTPPAVASEYHIATGPPSREPVVGVVDSWSLPSQREPKTRKGAALYAGHPTPAEASGNTDQGGIFVAVWPALG